MKLWNQSHEPVFKETTVHYIFTWSATGPIDVRSIAERLLVAGIAETTGSPASPEVRISPQLATLEKQIRDLGNVKGLYNIHTRLDLIKWVSRNPVLAARLVKHMRNREETAPASQSTGQDGLTEVEKQIKQVIWDAQATNAVQHAIESDLYAPSYLSDEPYLRLTLHGFPCWLDITEGGIPRKKDDTSDGIMANVLLLIHQSGCIQLTIVLQLPDSLSADALAHRTRASNLGIARSEIAEPVLRAYGKYMHASERSLAGQWAEETDRGVRWRTVDHENGATLVDVFEMYRDAIEQAASMASLGEWRCYPVVFIDSLGCCSSERQWIRHHRDDLVRLSSGAPRASLRKSLPLEDQALTTNFSVYCEIGWTIHIHWRFTSGRSDFAGQLATVVVVEHALLRYWQLVALAHRLASTQTDFKSIAKVQREAIFGLQEYRRTVLVFGTANEMANRLLQRLGEHEMYTRILESLGLLQQMIANEGSTRSARTQNTVAAAAIFATVVLGLPSIETILSTAKSVPRKGVIGQIVYPFHVLAHRGALGVWEGYLALLAVVVIVVVASIIRGRRMRMNRSSLPGVSWRYGTVKVIRQDAVAESTQSGRHSRIARQRSNSRIWSRRNGS
jgi:hypothetical protein